MTSTPFLRPSKALEGEVQRKIDGVWRTVWLPSFPVVDRRKYGAFDPANDSAILTVEIDGQHYRVSNATWRDAMGRVNFL